MCIRIIQLYYIALNATLLQFALANWKLVYMDRKLHKTGYEKRWRTIGTKKLRRFLKRQLDTELKSLNLK